MEQLTFNLVVTPQTIGRPIGEFVTDIIKSKGYDSWAQIDETQGFKFLKIEGNNLIVEATVMALKHPIQPWDVT